jgi:hypothetical protein
MMPPGTNPKPGILGAERTMIGQGLVPSVSFPFRHLSCRLASSLDLISTLPSRQLVILGADARLAPGRRRSVALVHADDNEERGLCVCWSIPHFARCGIFTTCHGLGLAGGTHPFSSNRLSVDAFHA